MTSYFYRRRCAAAVLLIFVCPAIQFAQDAAVPVWNPSDFLGMTITGVYEELGVPAGVFPFRGNEAWQDDVVFFYDSRIYLFLYDNRVWQARLDSRFTGSFLGCSMGMRRADVIAVLGSPVKEEGDWVLFPLPDRGFPVNARFFFREGLLADIYVYRGDF